MALIQLNSSAIATAGNYTLIEDVSQYRTISAVSDTNDTVRSTVSISSEAYTMHPPLGNIKASSSNSRHPIRYIVDGSMSTQWTAGSATGYIQVNLDGIDASSITHMTVSVINIGNADYGLRYGARVEVQGLYEDGTYDVIGNFTTGIGTTHRIAVPDGGISKYTTIKWKSNGGSPYYGFTNLCFEKNNYRVHTLDMGNGAELKAYGTIATLNSNISTVNLMANAADIAGIPPMTYRIYERDESGLPKLMLSNPTSIISGLGNTTLVDDLSQLVTMTSVDDIIERINTCVFAGTISSEEELPTTDVKVGTIYMVGTEGSASYEEFIYTEDGNWDRLGTLRQSDVDLSGYTNTEGMNANISDASTALAGNITTMSESITDSITGMVSSVTASIDAASDEVDAVLAGMSKEVEVVEDLPAEWPTDIIDEGMLVLLVDEDEDGPLPPATRPYTAPSLASNGTPFVDEYAVSSSSTLTHDGHTYGPSYITYIAKNDYDIWHSAGAAPHYINMTFKDEFCANHLLLKNRSISINAVYAPKDFVIDAKDSSGNWISVYEGTNPNSLSGEEYEVSFSNDNFYNEYRLTITTAYPGMTPGVHAVIDLFVLSGEVRA